MKEKEGLKKVIIIIIVLNIGILVMSSFQDKERSKITMITGAPVGMATVEIQEGVEISLPVNSVNFGNLSAGESRNTTDDNPLPFLIQNDGTVKVDITIAREGSSQPLFSGTGGGDNTSSFQFKVAPGSEGVTYKSSSSLTNLTNVPGIVSLPFLYELKNQNNKDEAEIELLINVPVDESAGSKSEALVFTATAS